MDRNFFNQTHKCPTISREIVKARKGTTHKVIWLRARRTSKNGVNHYHNVPVIHKLEG